MLEKKTYKILKRMYRKKRLTFNQIERITKNNEKKCHSKYISCLLTMKFIEIWLSEDLIDEDGIKDYKAIGYQITLSGCAFIEQRRRDLFNFWVPYTITTIVALAGLLVAVAGLLRSDQSGRNQDIGGFSHSQQELADCTD